MVAQSITPSGSAAGCVLHSTATYVCRAGQTITLTAAGGAPYSWSILEGVVDVAGSGSVVTVQPRVFGQYRWQVSTGAGTATITIGAVPTNEAGVVIPGSAVERLYMPNQLRWGLSPWPGVDAHGRDAATTLAADMTTVGSIINDDWLTPDAGTVSISNGGTVATFSGATNIQTLICAGGTTVPSGQDGWTLVVWTASGAERADAAIKGCPSSTTATIGVPGGTTWDLPTVASAQFSILTPTEFQFQGNQGFNKKWSFYDTIWAAYSMHRRTALTVYRDHGRMFGDRWFRSPFVNRGKHFGGPRAPFPRVWCIVGLMFYSEDVGGTVKADLWANMATQMFPDMDLLFGQGVGVAFLYTAGFGDLREEGNRVMLWAARMVLDPDAGRRAAVVAKVNAYLDWTELHKSTPYYIVERVGKGDESVVDVTVTNGSAIVTGTGIPTRMCSTEPIGSWAVMFYITETNSDLNAYRCVWNSSTQFTLVDAAGVNTPYTGASGAKKAVANVGVGVHVGNHQPYFLGFHGRSMAVLSRAYTTAGDATRAATSMAWAAKASAWLQTWHDSASRGVSYFAGGGNCPTPTSCPNGFTVDQMQFLGLETLAGCGEGYLQSGLTVQLTACDRFLAGAFGANGGPDADGSTTAPELVSPFRQGIETVMQGRFFSFVQGAGGAGVYLGARVGGAGAAAATNVSVMIGGGGTRTVQITQPNGEVTSQSCAGACSVSVDSRAGASSVR